MDNKLNIVNMKEHSKIPDYYTIVVSFFDGDKEEVRAVGHTYPFDGKNIEIFTTTEEYIVMPLSSIKSLRFKKDFADFVKLKKEEGKCKKNTK